MQRFRLELPIAIEGVPVMNNSFAIAIDAISSTHVDTSSDGRFPVENDLNASNVSMESESTPGPQVDVIMTEASCMSMAIVLHGCNEHSNSTQPSPLTVPDVNADESSQMIANESNSGNALMLMETHFDGLIRMEFLEPVATSEDGVYNDYEADPHALTSSWPEEVTDNTNETEEPSGTFIERPKRNREEENLREGAYGLHPRTRRRAYLMDQDSEMQQAMRDLDSYEHSPTVDSSRVGRSALNESTVGVEQSQRMELRRISNDEAFVTSQNHQQSSKSKEKGKDIKANLLVQQVPHPDLTPDLRHHQTNRHFMATILDPLRASSSAGSLFSSNPDVDTEKVEIDHERERNQNALRPLWHQHPSSPNHLPSLSVGQHSLSAERARTLSFPSRPDSRLSISSPRPGHQRQDSYDSLRSSSRASSRTSSPRGLLRNLNSIDSDEELLHEQERNWNSPRPHHSRSSSSGLHHPCHSNTVKRTQSLAQKIPSSPSSSTSSSHFTMDTSAGARRRAESLKTTTALSVHSSSPIRTLIIVSNASIEQLNIGHSSVLLSPLFNSKPQSTPSPNSLRSPSLSRMVPLPSPSVLQRKSGVRSSHIAVHTSSETKPTGTVLFPESGTAFAVVQNLQELPRQIPDAHSELVEDGNNDKANSDSTDTDTEAEESNQLVQENTPTLRSNRTLPLIEAPDPAEASSAYVSFESGASLQTIIASPPSPPPSSPFDGPSTPEAGASFSFPSTPPSRDYRNPTKLEFQTPSPTKNLPDLPNSPSDSSDNEDHEYPARIEGKLSSLKRP
ncbi:hypothetical protein EV359DRAFT_82245 [Lentinula novae-zelandiae]|nr:hypothetical protein EV359DRAFT_82245 [Lentinula novae-zelandiae]